ncbi:MAG: hypothetical protein E6Q98_12210 [Rhodospirillaceae bacterium]|nr:MAG: hypothetical protein E6Q98_12210 [Rhodospirillaceae bacterium]
MHIPQQQLQDLYTLWHSRLHHRRMPDRADFIPEDFRPWFGHIGIVAAEKPDYHSRYPRWRVVLSGNAMTEYDGGDWTGQLLDEAVPDDARGALLAPYDQMVDRLAPIYWMIDSAIGGSALAKYHRLLLPVTCGVPGIGKVIVGIYAEPDDRRTRPTVYDAMAATTMAKAWQAAS